jgi:hypothetical protein
MYPIPVPQTAVAATASQVPAGVSPIPRASAAPKPPNEFELKAKMFAQRMDTSWDQLSKVIGYDRATKVYRADKKKVKGWWDAIQMRASRGLSEYAGNEFRGGLASDDQQEFMGASEGLLNAVLRFDSGASVLPPEYNRYTMEFLPGPLTSDKEDLNKIIRIEATIEAMKEIGRIAGKNVDEMSDAELKALKASGAIDAAITRNVAKLGGTYTPINYGDPAASGGLTPEDEDLLNQYPEN